MKKTKIIGTIGPASMDYEVMKKLVLAGLNVIRINLSHANITNMNTIMKNVKRIRKELKVPLPVMIDTRGPELRVKTFKNGSVNISKGQQFIFTARSVLGDETKVSIDVPRIINNFKVGGKILACDGLITFEILEIKGKDVITKALNDGVISNRKSLCVPGVKFNVRYLNPADKEDILWGIKNDVDFVAASFVNSKEDVLSLKKFIAQNNGNMKVISKIESQRGVKNIDSIINVSDGIMVARGDLGVEMPIEILPELQKLIINKTVKQGKTVITATEMLESMIYNNRPTRAEVSDIANSLYDGTSCVMLSGETAMGKHPVEAVKTMARVVQETEKFINYNNAYISNLQMDTPSDMISQCVASLGLVQNVKLILSYTNTGDSAGLISRFRPKVNIVAATSSEKVFRQMEIRWGVTPLLTGEFNSTDEMFEYANKLVKKNKLAKIDDTIAITCGEPKKIGGTNLIKIVQIK